jgi:YqaJ-like viral recombinase domain
MRTDSSMRVNHHRRQFIGGSDARIIMGEDEAALHRLWKEKRGEVDPEDLSGDLLVLLGTVTEQLNRHWYEKNTGQVVTEVQAFHPVHRWIAATLDGRVESTGAVFEAKFMLPLDIFGRRGRRKAYGPAAAQYVRVKDGGALDHHRRGQMGGNDHSGRSALPAPAADRRAEVLALRSERRAPSPLRHRAAAAQGRSGPNRRHERIQCLGRV